MKASRIILCESRLMEYLEDRIEYLKSWIREKNDDDTPLSDYQVQSNEEYQYEIELVNKLIKALQKGL